MPTLASTASIIAGNWSIAEARISKFQSLRLNFQPKSRGTPARLINIVKTAMLMGQRWCYIAISTIAE